MTLKMKNSLITYKKSFIRNKSIYHMHCTVGNLRKFFVVSNYNESLPETVAQVEEEFMKLLFIAAVETARRLVGKNNIEQLEDVL